MDDRKRDLERSDSFDELLEESLPALPPEDVAAEVTPWKRAMKRVLTGMALCTVTLNFLYLDYLLPAIGMVLTLLGFRALRRENGWFMACFLTAALRAAQLFPQLALNTTILPGLFPEWANAALSAAGFILLFLQYFCLWRGLRAVREKAGLAPGAGAAGALLLWYALVVALALLQYNGLIIGLAMVVGYFFILRGLYRLSGALDEAGYAVRSAPVRLSDRWLAGILAAVLAAGCICGYLFGGSYPMRWVPVDPAEQSQVTDIRAKLLELGFPDYVLDDLTAEDIAACADAAEVVTDVHDHPVNDGRKVVTTYGSDRYTHTSIETVYDVKELRITGVAVRLDGDEKIWMVFHHFLWTADPGFYGTESIQLWPVYREISEGWALDGDFTGRVLYDRDGRAFAAPYYALGTRTYTSSSIFWGQQTASDVFAEFSLPRNGTRQRGYVAYPVQSLNPGWLFSSWINYTHQSSWLQYPAVTAAEKRMTNGWNDAGAFLTVQDALQFYPSKDGTGTEALN